MQKVQKLMKKKKLLRKKNKQLKEELSKKKESIQDSINPEETKKVFIDLKVKLEEAKLLKQHLENNWKKRKGYRWN